MIKQVLTAIFALFLSASANSLTFERQGGTFAMSGPIEKDDSLLFLMHLASWDIPPTVFHIDSTGGDLKEAMAIGEIIRESYIPVWSGDRCYSACVFIFAAGVERRAIGELGLHRPYYNASYFSELSAYEARLAYDEAEKSARQYLETMGFPREATDKMFQVNSSQMYKISNRKANRWLGKTTPFFDEWLAASCGRLTQEQVVTINSYNALRALESNNQSIIYHARQLLGPNLKELATNAIALRSLGLLEPFISLNEQHRKCRIKKTNSHVYSFHKAIKQEFNKVLEEVTSQAP